VIHTVQCVPFEPKNHGVDQDGGIDQVKGNLGPYK
jgi:hypothetical protein